MAELSVGAIWFIVPSVPLFIVLPIAASFRRHFWMALAIVVLGTLALYAFWFWLAPRSGNSAVKNAVVLLSGGLDSMVTRGNRPRTRLFGVIALTIDYNQRHRVELEAARTIAGQLALRHIVLPLDLRTFGGSALTSDIAVPKSGVECGIPVTYVPARNTIFLSLALGLAEASGARDIFIGVNALDYSGYPDCRPEFIAQFEKVANLATKAGVEGRAFQHSRAAPGHEKGGNCARIAATGLGRRQLVTAATTPFRTGVIAASATPAASRQGRCADGGGVRAIRRSYA